MTVSTAPPASLPASATGADLAIECCSVSYSYDRRGSAIEDVSLSVARGELLAVVGPNGGGKTTFVNLLMGFLRPTKGEVRILGGSPLRARRAGQIGYVPQRSTAERGFPISVEQMVALGADRARAHAALDLVNAGELANKHVGALSGGQFQRALIARALAMEPEILLLDEPAVGIDAKGQAEFAQILKRIREERSLALVLVSHDLRTIATGGASCDRVACLRRSLHFHDAPGGLTPGILGEVFRHDLEWVFGDVHVDAHHASECEHDHHGAHTPEGNGNGNGGGGGSES